MFGIIMGGIPGIPCIPGIIPGIMPGIMPGIIPGIIPGILEGSNPAGKPGNLFEEALGFDPELVLFSPRDFHDSFDLRLFGDE